MNPQFPQTNRLLIWGTQAFDQFTEEQLAYGYAGNWLQILWHNLHKGVNWKPASPDGKPKKKCCEGTIKEMGISGDSDIYVALDAKDCEGLLLPANNGTLECELPWQDRKSMLGPLLRIKKGGRVKICGWWTLDYGHEGKTEIHDITYIKPLPDRPG